MDVENTALKMGKCFRSQLFHIPGKCNDIDLIGDQGIKDRLIEAIGVGVCLPAQMEARYAFLSRPPQGGRIAVIADHDNATRLEGPVLCCVDYCLHVASAVRCKKAYVHDIPAYIIV